MAKLRRAIAYRRVERSYTRRSKYREKSYIRGNPPLKVVSFDMGNLQKTFPIAVELISKKELQIRENAIESGRSQANRILESGLGKTGFHMKIKMYPHHVLRENPLAAGAGADRMSTGMAGSFGKPIGNACQVKQGTTLVTVGVPKTGVETARKALKMFGSKLPTACSIRVIEKAY